ncbi:MAG: 4'-phosphopantetheinyl transferase superfamily protein [Cyanobacteria bacterium P01_D01_bin.105]
MTKDQRTGDQKAGNQQAGYQEARGKTADAVQLWQIPLAVPDTIVTHYWQHLSQDEKMRGDRYRFAQDRRRFVVARSVLRSLLSQQFDQSPADIQFCYGEYGKPALARSFGHPNCDFHFNLSHSGELALCVLGGDRLVGVDIEYLKNIQRLDSMMERCLTHGELADVRAQPKTAQLEAFLQRWTCKEAYLKAIGLGLAQSMQSIEVNLCPDRLASVPKSCAAGWQLKVIDVPKNYVGALVTAGETSISMHDWQHP